MPIPHGLRFKQRIAPYTDPQRGKGHYILCKRSGHSKFVKFIPGRLADARDVLDAHDATHSPFLDLPHAAPSITIGQLCDEYLARLEKQEVDGLRAPETTKHYHYASAYIRDGMRVIGVRWVRELDPERIGEFVAWMRRHAETKGAAIVSVLAALKTMIRKRGLPVHWQIPHDDIRPERRTKRELDAPTIRALVAAMPAGSIEEACAYLKARTGCRDVEIYTARKEEFDLDVSIEVDGRVVPVGIFRPVLHAKGRAAKRRHVYVITSDAAEKVRPFVERAAAGGYVFVDEHGDHVTRTSMKSRIRAASRKAGFINERSRVGTYDSIGQIRSEVITLVTEETSLEDAQRHIGHTTPRTTEKWYVKDRISRKKLAEKYRPAEIIANALPLR